MLHSYATMHGAKHIKKSCSRTLLRNLNSFELQTCLTLEELTAVKFCPVDGILDCNV